MLEIKIKRLREVDKAKMRVKQEKCAWAKFKESLTLKVRQEQTESFPTAIRNVLRWAAASLKNVVMAPLQAKKDGRRDHHRAGLINIHDVRVTKV